MSENKLRSLKEYAGNSFLQADDIKDNNEEWTILEASEVEGFGDKPAVGLNVSNGSVEKLFTLNMTNCKKFLDAGLESGDLKGIIFTMKKVLVTNPTTKKEVESLRVDKIRKP